MTKRIAAIGDVHGLIDELRELYSALEWASIDGIWHLGDLVDRGPDSGAVIEFCRQKGIRGVLGNHENSILVYKDTTKKPKSEDKRRTVESIRSKEDWNYLSELPPLHVFDDLGLVLVHGGLEPGIPLYRQEKDTIIRAQLVHPWYPHRTRWFNVDRDGVREEEHLKRGWRRWYELYDHAETCIYGHTSYAQPKIHQNPGYGRTIGIDTGSCFGGALTACIYDSRGEFSFMSIKAKKLYFPQTTRGFWEK